MDAMRSEARASISVLTAPPSSVTTRLACALARSRSFIRCLLTRQKFPQPPRYGGHYAVTRSLVEGLLSAEIPHNYNPPTQQLLPTCIVLSGCDTLQFAIEQKRRGRIKKLYAGPNIVTLPDEHDNLIVSPEVDFCVVPSKWVEDLYLTRCPGLQGRTLIWAAGICADEWIPDRAANCQEQDGVLIYIKGERGRQLFVHYHSVLLSWFGDLTVLEYGRYDRVDYYRELNHCLLMIVFGGTESQGLALAEAWAMDIPTWVHVADSWDSPGGSAYPASAAPYLSSYTGAFFSDERTLKALRDQWARKALAYAPRNWVLANMTDTLCAAKLTDRSRG